MKKLFVTTEVDNMVLFVDNDNKAYVYEETAFDEELTLEVAKATAYENAEGCETAEEVKDCQGTGYVIDYNEDDFETVTEF